MNRAGQEMAIAALVEHPSNAAIYGMEDVTLLAESIRESGYIKPIIVNQHNVIVSGHRRTKAAKLLGYDTIPCERIETESETHLLEMLLLENRYRNKDTRQKLREAEKWEEIERAKAKQRFGGRHKNQPTVENFPQLEEGKTRDIVAQKVGFGNGRTYETAKKVDKKITEFEERGEHGKAEVLRVALNKSVSGAKKLADTGMEGVTPDFAEKILNEEVTVAKVVQEAKKAERVEHQKAVYESKVATPEILTEYDLIYCDPPWKYDFSETKSREIENHYPTMTLEQLMEIELPAAENCVLYMWATAPKMDWAMKLIECWGFSYTSQIIWDKQNIGSGYWARGRHELLLIATKGKVSPPSPSDRIPSVYSEKRGKHSAKPLFFYGYLKKAHPYLTKIELFSRRKVEGFANWGNENLEQ